MPSNWQVAVVLWWGHFFEVGAILALPSEGWHHASPVSCAAPHGRWHRPTASDQAFSEVQSSHRSRWATALWCHTQSDHLRAWWCSRRQIPFHIHPNWNLPQVSMPNLEDCRWCSAQLLHSFSSIPSSCSRCGFVSATPCSRQVGPKTRGWNCHGW